GEAPRGRGAGPPPQPPARARRAAAASLSGGRTIPLMPDRVRRAKAYYAKWRWFERNSFPWNRIALHRELMKRECYARWPLEGNALKALRDGRLEIGVDTHFEPHVWLS